MLAVLSILKRAQNLEVIFQKLLKERILIFTGKDYFSKYEIWITHYLTIQLFTFSPF